MAKQLEFDIQIQLNQALQELNSLNEELRQVEREGEAAARGVEDFGQQAQESAQKTFKFSENIEKIGEKLTSTGKAFIGVSAGIGAAMGGLALAGANYSSEIAQTEFLMNRLTSTGEKVNLMTEEQARAIGLTAKQYNDALVSIETFGKSMGLTGEELNTFSDTLTVMVADMAAFADVPFNEAADAMKSALVGNYEALGAYNIELSDGLINQGEYAKKLGKTTQQMTMQEKTMAIMSAITERGAHVTGFAAEESDQFGTKLRMLKEDIKETAGKIGENLLPILAPLIENIGNTVQKVAEWIQNNPELVQTLMKVAGIIAVVVGIVGVLAVALGIAAAASVAFSAANLPITLTVMAVVAALMVLIGAIVYLAIKWDEIKAKTLEIWENIKNTLLETWENIKNFFTDTWNAIKQLAEDVWNAIDNFLTEKLGNIWTSIKDILGTIKNYWDTTWTNIKNFFSAIWDGIKGIWDAFGKLFSGDWQGFWDGIKNAFSTIWEGIKTYFSEQLNNLITTVTNLIPQMFEAGKNLISGLWDGLKNMWESVKKWFSESTQWIIDKVKNIFKIGSPSKVFEDIGKQIDKGLVIGLDDGFKDVENTMAKMGQLSGDFINGYGNTLTPTGSAGATTNNYDYSNTTNYYNDNTTINAPQVNPNTQQSLRYLMEQVQIYKNYYSRSKGLR